MARIGHKKSRNGCSRCKQRKVKCDERRPCGVCIKRGLSCSLISSPSLDSASLKGQVSPNAISFIGTEDVQPLNFSKGTSIAPKCQRPSGWTEDLGLMSHYASITSATLPGANRRVWQIEIPKVGVAYPFLMHQILAVSAFHLARLNPSERQEYLSRALQHQHHAICGIRGEVATVTPRNCHALFAGSSLLFIGAFAACARTSGGNLEQKVNDLLGVFVLVRGVNSILNLFKDVIRNGTFGEFIECNSYAGGTGLLSSLVERLHLITESLDAGKVDHVVKAQAGEAIFALGESAGRASTAAPELNVAIIWPMIIKDGFLQLIRDRHPAALVVIAHYCTVLHAVGSKFWFLENWGHEMLDAIVEVHLLHSERPSLLSANMQAWQYTAIKDTLESSLTLNEKATPPDALSLPQDHALVQVTTAGINPVEYKLPEAPLYGKFMVQPPASPGLDFCGRIKAKNTINDSLKEDQLVFGALSIASKFPKFGTLGQLIVAPISQLTVLPEGVAPDDAATVGTAGMTVYQSLPQDLIKHGSKIFINGGSGGVGSFTVQFAKALGATVTTTCSTANVQLCHSLGADEVLDYRNVDVMGELKKKGQIFDLAIDNVGTPDGLYEQSHHFLKPDGTFLQVAMQKSLLSMLRRSLLPSRLGGGKRQYRLVRVNINSKDLQQVGQWMAQGKVRAVIDEKFEWKEAPKAYKKLRLGRTAGKIVVRVRHA
ncbi:hypothetical protein FSARC_4644 [Fusarium sarcochroum]|uniref:Zn(2)-C6 fungal-type domain-containing protein n=1 Tax=Fusarium sarcochroum TaxID=1208366 RepID=A0A8H4XAF1_9HYPO|nr:hypothetical protein FSARC_4644 [Fusarium sarcochroum]